MPSLDPVLLRWAVQAAAPGAEVTEVRGLRDGGSPWLLRLGRARRGAASCSASAAATTPPGCAPRWRR